MSRGNGRCDRISQGSRVDRNVLSSACLDMPKQTAISAIDAPEALDEFTTDPNSCLVDRDDSVNCRSVFLARFGALRAALQQSLSATSRAICEGCLTFSSDNIGQSPIQFFLRRARAIVRNVTSMPQDTRHNFCFNIGPS